MGVTLEGILVNHGHPKLTQGHSEVPHQFFKRLLDDVQLQLLTH
jgi:hypothetical protein